MTHQKSSIMAKKKVEDNGVLRTQFEQLLGELFLANMRAEFLAFKLLPKEDYQEMCKNVADFTKKICTNQK